MSEIKECPYCESKNCKVDDWSYGLDYYGECNDCGARGPLVKSKSDAILLWNAAANQLDMLRVELEQLRKERDEACAVVRRLYATNKYLIKTFACQPVPVDKTYEFVYDTHANTGYVIRNDKAG